MTNDIDTRPSQVTDESTRKFEHITIENDGAPDECAIVPTNATDVELLTNWIAAYDDGFVSLETMR
ncbi:DUF7511 domain-containing protein [Halostagnicola bangensis]